jgi:hypothetical protein
MLEGDGRFFVKAIDWRENACTRPPSETDGGGDVGERIQEHRGIGDGLGIRDQNKGVGLELERVAGGNPRDGIVDAGDWVAFDDDVGRDVFEKSAQKPEG